MDAGSLERGAWTYLPAVPGRVEFALETRRALLALRPRVVAVELPAWLEPLYLAAIDRLPMMSVIVYPEDEDGERGVYLVVEPADPFVEAVRTARELGAELVFLEAGAQDRPHLPDLYPDAYAALRIGMRKFIDLYRLQPQPRGEATAAHAAAMAWRLQGADLEAPTAVVVSLNLLDPLLDAGAIPQLDLMSLVGRYGRQPQRAAERLLSEGLYYLACSDAHRAIDVDLVRDAIARLRALVGREEADALMGENPRRILAGNPDFE